MSFPTPGGAALIAIALWHAYLLSGLTAVVSQHNVDSVAPFLAGGMQDKHVQTNARL